MRKPCVLFLLLAASVAAGDKTAPGTYHDWNDLDDVEIVQPFHFADYGKLMVVALDRSGVQLPPETENTYKPTKAVFDACDTPFLEGLQKGVEKHRKGVSIQGEPAALVAQPAEPGTQSPEPAAAPQSGPKAPLLRGQLLVLDPGSRAKRYFAGFGAGATRAKISVEISDAGSGQVLARFTHEKRAGFGLTGGSYDGLLKKSIREVGEAMGVGLKFF
jgi:hypothetical protein